MAKIIPPRIVPVEKTEIGKRLLDPAEQARHDQIVSMFREAARPEIKLLKRSERITGDDLRQMIG